MVHDLGPIDYQDSGTQVKQHPKKCMRRYFKLYLVGNGVGDGVGRENGDGVGVGVGLGVSRGVWSMNGY